MKILGDGKAIIRMDTNKAVKQEKYFLKEARCRRHSASFLPYGKKQLSHCGGEETCRCCDPPQAENPALQDFFLCASPRRGKSRYASQGERNEKRRMNLHPSIEPPRAEEKSCYASQGERSGKRRMNLHPLIEHPCARENALCVARNTQRVEEDESSLLV